MLQCLLGLVDAVVLYRYEDRVTIVVEWGGHAGRCDLKVILVELRVENWVPFDPG